MTKEEAVVKLEAKLECLTRDVSGTNIDCNKCRCDECKFHYAQGNMGEQIECLRMAIESLKTKPCEDAISRRAAIDTAIEAADKWDGGFSVERSRIITEALNELSSVQPQKVIRCKDCNEWHRGKNRDGSDVYSDEGYCSVHRIITGENYYCGDAERR